MQPISPFMRQGRYEHFLQHLDLCKNSLEQSKAVIRDITIEMIDHGIKPRPNYDVRFVAMPAVAVSLIDIWGNMEISKHEGKFHNDPQLMKVGANITSMLIICKVLMFRLRT